MLGALLLYLPLSFGGVLPDAPLAIVGVGALLGLCLVWRGLVGERFVWSWAHPAIAGFAGVAWLQLELGTTKYAYATECDLRLLIGLAACFVAATQIYARPAAARRFLATAFGVGALISLIAVAQVVSETRAIYWWSPTPSGGIATGGPFVNRSHLCQFVNLTLGCGLGLVLVRADERRVDRMWPLFGGIALLGVSAILLSTSRGGAASLVSGAIIATLLLHKTRAVPNLGWPVFGVLLASVFFVALSGPFDPLVTRLESIEDPGAAYAGRLDLLRDSLSAWQAHPWLGFGQGAYKVAFPAFDSSMRPGTAAHAENFYVEILAETGILGFGLIALLVSVVVTSITRLVRERIESIDRLAFGLIFGFVAIAVHSWTDFGLRMPAVSYLALLAAAAAVAQAQRVTQPAAVRSKHAGDRLHEPTGESQQPQPVFGRATAVIAGLVIVGAPVTSLRSARDSIEAYAEWRSVDAFRERLDNELRAAAKRAARGSDNSGKDHASVVRRTETQLSTDDWQVMLEAARRSIELEPGQVERRFKLAILRWQRALLRHGATLATAPEAIRSKPALRTATQQCVSELLEAREHCPSYGPVWSVAGQLKAECLGHQEKPGWIHEGFRLAPHHPATCIASARQLVREGKAEEALARFRRAIRVGASKLRAADGLVRLDRFDIARQLVDGDYAAQAWLAKHLEKGGSAPEIVEALRQDALQTLIRLCDSGRAPAWCYERLAHHYDRAEDFDKALRYWRIHVNRRPGSPRRFEYARALVRLGRKGDARRELRRLLASHPTHRAGKKLLVELGG